MRKNLVIIAGTLAACGSESAQPRPAPSIVDYLVQNVCTDAASNIGEGDPASCPTSRDIVPGETATYVLTDFDKANGKRYQAVSSLPDGEGRVRIAKRMNDGTGFHEAFAQDRDGYDLIEYEGGFVSAIATSDPGCWAQRFSGAGNGDGWVMFPAQLPFSSGSTRHGMTLTRVTIPLPPNCPATEAVSNAKSVNAAWTAPAPFTFDSGKTLRTIRTEHQAHFDLSRTNNAIETMFFTREYGLSRWEAWIPQTRCRQERGEANPACDPDNPANILRGRCDPSSGRAMRGGQLWVRIDCRDNTFLSSQLTQYRDEKRSTAWEHSSASRR